MKQYGINQVQMASELDISIKTVNNWFNAKRVKPKTHDAVGIAKLLHTTVEYLETGVNVDAQALTPQEKKLLDTVRKLSPEKFHDITVIASALSENPSNETLYQMGAMAKMDH